LQGTCLLALVSLACAVLTPPAPPAPTVSPSLESGLAAYENGRYDQAIADLTTAIAESGDDAYAYYLRGSSYYNRYSQAYPGGAADPADFYRAITDFTKAIELNPQYAEAYNFRALAYDGLGQTGHALDDYNRALQLNPGLATAYYGRGLVYEEQGDTESAIADYRRFLELSDDAYWRAEAEKRLSALEAAP
jgi:tetratricopeptide (TPR) repeat protein